jgi:hypothetical protein
MEPDMEEVRRGILKQARKMRREHIRNPEARRKSLIKDGILTKKGNVTRRWKKIVEAGYFDLWLHKKPKSKKDQA